MGTGALALYLVAATALGQGEVPTYTMRERSLQIPIRVRPEKAHELTDVLLFVSTDQGKRWVQCSKAKPADAAFAYTAPSDGQYWFKVCVLDTAGRRDPEDIAASTPDLKIIIDSQRPLLRISDARRDGDDVLVAWETLGTQANLMTLKLDYRSVDSGANAPWQPVPINPTANGQQRFRAASAGPVAIRLQVTDSAGTPHVVVKELPAAAPLPFTPVMESRSAGNSLVAAPPTNAIQQANSISAAAPPPQIVPPGSVGLPATGAGGLPAPVLPTDIPMPAPAVPAPQSAPPTAASPIVAPPAPAPAPPAAVADTPPPGLTPLPTTRTGAEPFAPAPTAGGPVATQPASPPTTIAEVPAIQHVNESQVGIDFEVERHGPSGVKKIEVYWNRDDGGPWRKYWETADTKSPLPLQLPKEDGPYAFRLVLVSGVNQTLGPPQPRDPPHVRLLIDRRPPKVDLYPLAPDPSGGNAVIVQYGAADVHLAEDGVALFWSAQPTGGWRPIKLDSVAPATGPGVTPAPAVVAGTWALPPDLPDRVYLRITARDRAGNTTEIITQDPQTVDLVKPTARVKGLVPRRP